MNMKSTPVKTANIVSLIRHRATLHPDFPAVISSRTITSYRQLYSLITAVSEKITDIGVSQGDMVGLSFQLSLQHLVALLAVSHAGAVSVPLHPAWSLDIRTAAAKRFNITQILAQDARYKLEGIGFTLLRDTINATGELHLPPCSLSEDAPFRVAMSAKTTDYPKGVMFTHGYMRQRMSQAGCAWTQTSRMIPGDLNYTIGFVFALSVLASGGTIVIPESMQPNDFIRSINAHAVTHIFISPAVAMNIAANLHGDTVHFPTLKQLRVVGYTPSMSLINELASRFSPNVIVPYGTSEFGIISLANNDQLQKQPDCVGKVLPWANLEIVDEVGETLPLNSVGRIRVAAGGMPTGYYNDEMFTSARFNDGWFYSGDRGRVDADGLLYIEGRGNIMQTVNGNSVSFVNIEKILENHPQIKEAVLIPLFDAKSKTEQLLAVIIPYDLLPTDLHIYCSEKIIEAKIKKFVFLKKVPRDVNGTVQRDLLISIVRKGLTRKNDQKSRVSV